MVFHRTRKQKVPTVLLNWLTAWESKI